MGWRTVAAVVVTSAICLFSDTARAAEAPSGLQVSDNKRFLIRSDGSPFFYIGDTAWELFHRLNREEADRYLQDRAGKGFTVIQAVAPAELQGHADPIPYGHLPHTHHYSDKPAPPATPNKDA